MTSLLTRNEPESVEPLWNALLELDEDVIEDAWDVIAYGDLRETPIAQEMRRRDEMSA
jgi:hypothetical protein